MEGEKEEGKELKMRGTDLVRTEEISINNAMTIITLTQILNTYLLDSNLFRLSLLLTIASNILFNSY